MSIFNKKLTRFLCAAIILSMAVISLPSITYGATAQELQRQKELNAVIAARAKKDAEAKKQQAAQVQTQMAAIDNEITSTENNLTLTQGQINDTQNKIAELLSKIRDEEENYKKEKEKMDRVLASWYMEDQKGLLETLIGSDNLSEVVTKQQYYDSIKQQLTVSMEKIDAFKAELQKQQDEKSLQLQSLKDLAADQQTQQKNLEYQMNVKNRLLNDTTKMIGELNAQAAAAQARIAQIDAQIRALSATNRWGNQIVSSNDPSWYYSQTGNYTHLGNSPYTVSQYGCLITSIAMIAKYYGNNVTPTSIASNTGNFDREGYMIVTSPSGTGVNVSTSRSVNWNTIDEEISNGHPVIVSIYLPSVGAVNSDGSSHFIVIKGKVGNQYLMHDPIGDGRGYNTSQVRSMKIVRDL